MAKFDNIALREPRFTDQPSFQNWVSSPEFYVSSSSLSSLYSPYSFMQYYLDTFKETQAMSEGTLLHCMILEPDEVVKRYAVCDVDTPTSANQKGFANVFLETGDYCGAYIENYACKGKSNDKIAEEGEKLMNALMPYLDFCKTVGDRIVVQKELFDKLQVIAERVKNNKAAVTVLNRVTSTEKKFEMTYKGYKIKGMIDCLGICDDGRLVISDLKKRADSDPHKVKNEVIYGDLGIQLAIYAIAGKLVYGVDFQHQDISVIAVDLDGNVSVTQVQYDTLRMNIDRLNAKLANLNDIIFQEKWQMSYEYYAQSIEGVYFA